MSIDYFNDKAKEWDNDPMKLDRAFILANEVKDYLKPDTSMNAFELGCGTGLLGYFLRDSFHSITLADSSEEMIKVLEERINNEHINNLHPLLMDFLTYEPGAIKYDVILTFMTLHHISDLDTIISKFNKLLRNSGYLCIADLEKEDGTFHENMTDFEGYLGFEKKNLEKLLTKVGFKIRMYKTFYQIEKTMNDGKKKVFPLFMMMAQKTEGINFL